MRKKLLCQIISCFLLITIASAQTVVTVNNTPGETANYNDLQIAVNSVADGSIILLQPGPVSYGNVIINKRVSIIGAGYFLGLNPEPFTQAYLQSSITGWITFDIGSNGSQLMGLSMTGDVTINQRSRISCIKTSNIIISRCMISPAGGVTTLIWADSSSGITLQQNFIRTPAGFGNLITCNSRASNGIQFLNNIFENAGGFGHILPTEYFTNYATSVLFKNNVIPDVSSPGFYPSATTLVNNIIFQGPGFVPISCIAADRNVGNANYQINPPGPLGTNITSAVMSDVFILNTGSVIYGPDGRYQLKPGSPAIGFGQGAIDCGAYGGGGSYVLSGIPIIPNIYLGEIDGTPSAANGLRLRLKVKANQ